MSQSVTEPAGQTNSSGLPDMNNFLQIMGQTLNTNNVNSSANIPGMSTILSPSLPVTTPTWVLRSPTIGRPTALGPCLVVNTQPNASVLPNVPVSVSVPTVSTNSDISAILNQITSVNESNVRIALKAARRCIETFSADIRRLEQMAAKASSVNDLGRVVRSFHSIYRFHLFARLSNLAARMREEIPKVPEKPRATVTTQTTTLPVSMFAPIGPTSIGTILSVPATPPAGLTIDLTDEVDGNRESSDPTLAQGVPKNKISSVEADLEQTENKTQLDLSSAPPKISDTIGASVASPNPNSPVQSATVFTTSPTGSPKSNSIPPPVTKSPELTPSSTQTEKACLSVPSAVPNEESSKAPETVNSKPKPRNSVEADDLGPVDDDDDDDIDWKLDMLANLSQAETPNLIFAPNTQVENNNTQCPPTSVDDSSTRQSGADVSNG